MRAPSSTMIAPAVWAAKAIHSLRAVRLRRRASNRVPTGSPAAAAASTPERAALAITVGTPDHEAIRAASSLLAMPPLPRPLPPRPAAIDSSGSSTATSRISSASACDPRVGGVQAVEVGQQHEQGGAHVVRHERGETVVVAVADVVGGDRVVLVDDRHGAEREQAGERAPGVEVLAAVDEVVRDEQRLGGDETVIGEGVVPAAHQPWPGRRRRSPAAWRCRSDVVRGRGRRHRRRPRPTTRR